MISFRTGGLSMKKPYLSKSNYILSMSNYKKDIWVNIWDKLYEDFFKKNKNKLYPWRYHYYHIYK